MHKKYLMIAMAAFVSLIMVQGVALGTIFTVDGIDDAGLYPGQGANTRFVPDGCDVSNPNAACATLNAVSTADRPQKFTSEQDVKDYAIAKDIKYWSLQSAGNIWSSDLIVGESLMNLSAGTYRVKPEESIYNAYQYDTFGWSQYSGYWWWELHINANYVNAGTIVNDYYMLGSYNPEVSADLAFSAVEHSFIDITLPLGGALNFWIWDTNSVDNAGGLTFSVVPVPEPSALLLSMMGLFYLAWRIQKEQRQGRPIKPDSADFELKISS